ncbi:hypothetical protein E2C01_024461 [Portunus trituberculatus]|uniref:Uncharacterized protein n=1 Tax=Portunus trituberculatus TaxID=210409 RepID=A0A5B7ECE0_PORTR|nr:hypothetical protein [Portunus trituberculatus]
MCARLTIRWVWRGGGGGSGGVRLHLVSGARQEGSEQRLITDEHEWTEQSTQQNTDDVEAEDTPYHIQNTTTTATTSTGISVAVKEGVTWTSARGVVHTSAAEREQMRAFLIRHPAELAVVVGRWAGLEWLTPAHSFNFFFFFFYALD